MSSFSIPMNTPVPLQAVLVVLTIWIVKYVLEMYVSTKRALKLLRDCRCPGGEFLWLHPFRSLSLISGPMFPLRGQMGYYFADFSLYAKYGSTCLSSIVFWTSMPAFWVADADAVKVICTDRRTFSKDVEAYEALNIYGENMVGTEGSDWKRHRAVAMPAFNEANIALVWSDTIRIVNEWFDQLDSTHTIDEDKAGPTIDVVSAMVQATLLVISSAGFGRRASWIEDSDTDPPPGHKLAFRPALMATIDGLFIKMLTPNWLYALSGYIQIPYVSPALKHTREAFEELRHHMLDVVSSARAWVGGGKAIMMDAALLKNLVEANMAQEGELKRLTDEELLSNTFTFLLAGHETSAHSLTFAIVLLALYPDIQNRLFQEVSEVWPAGAPTTSETTPYKETFPKLRYTTAVFYETIRLFTPVARLGKCVQSDTTLPARRFVSGDHRNAEKITVRVPRGSIIIMDILALHRNPLYWGDDPETFDPERFIDTESYKWPRDAFLAFSAGARSCIGQRFAVTESVCILAALVRRYEILVPDDLRSKPLEEQKKTLLHWKPGVTITPKNARVRLRLRE